MTNETTSFLAQSRTFQISPTSGEVIEIALPGAASSVVALTNTTIDSKYKILELLGEGGMGAVYRARHLMLDKDIALKTFRSSNYSAEVFERFNREIRAVAKLAHPNIVLVFDSGLTEANQPYYTMELLVGQSLEERLKKSGALPIDEALTIFTDVAEGLKSAHNNGIVHRDLKPGNIFLSTPATPSNTRACAKIVDFGIAKLADNSPSKQYQTTAGCIFGSPLYMSPEQSRGDEVDQRSDIYSFGCALFEALTGQPPLVGSHALETMILHQTTVPPRLSQRMPGQDFPQLLESFVGRLMHKSPEHRPQSFDEIIAALGRVRKLTQGAAGTKATQEGSFDQGLDKSEPLASRALLTKPLLLLISALVITGVTAAAFILMRGSSNETKQLRRADAASTTASTASETAGDNLLNEEAIRAARSSSTRPPTTRALASSNPDILQDSKTELIMLDQTKNVHNSGPKELIIPPGLKAKDIIFTTLSAKDFDVISKSSLTELNLPRCQFENSQLTKLSKLKLISLAVSISDFDDTGAAALVGCKELAGLRADGTLITDKGCISMAKYPSLTFLDISRTAVTDAGLAQLAKMAHLYDLRLNGVCGVTISGVTRLCEQCRGLGMLNVTSCQKINAAQVKLLRAQFPRLRLTGDGDKPKSKDTHSLLN